MWKIAKTLCDCRNWETQGTPFTTRPQTHNEYYIYINTHTQGFSFCLLKCDVTMIHLF